MSERNASSFPTRPLTGQEELLVSGSGRSVWVEVSGGLPKLASKHGKWRAFDAPGKLEVEDHFANGQLTGRWTFWHDNGCKKAEGEYVRDLREGKWVEWNDRGEVVAEQVFRQGRPAKS